MQRHGYEGLRTQAREIFDRNSLIHCPYLGTAVVLNAEGLHHLRYSAERERGKPEQMMKFRLLPLSLDVIRKSGTVQEYRKIWQPIGNKRADGMRVAKEVEYWGLVAIVGQRPDKKRVILRRVGNGNIMFWSVMRGAKILPDGRPRLAPENLEAD